MRKGKLVNTAGSGWLLSVIDGHYMYAGPNTSWKRSRWGKVEDGDVVLAPRSHYHHILEHIDQVSKCFVVEDSEL
jgi:hypothetical protein